VENYLHHREPVFMPGPTQNSRNVESTTDLDRVLKEIALTNQRLSTLMLFVRDLQSEMKKLANPRIAVDSPLRNPSSRTDNISQGMKAHDDQ
jgi:hypothetical protein